MITEKKITIKAYDEEEHSSKGIVILPIRVGPLQKDTSCQVLDLDLSYDILLGRPWIHDIQVVPSTYNQCLKFPYNGKEISISADSNPFQYCSNLKPTQEIIVPRNKEASSSNTQTIEKSFASILSSMEKQIKLRDRGNGEYSISQLPLSPKSYGKPSNSKQQPIVKHLPIFDGAFVSVGTLSEETEDKNVLQGLYKDEEVQTKISNVRIPTEKYGKGFNILQKMGYTRTSPIGKRKEGILEPIQPHT